MAVVATRRRDNDGRFPPTTNCHPNPPWFAGRRERLRCGPERALDEVAASELLPKDASRGSRAFYIFDTHVNRQGETQDFCGGGAVDCAARAEPRSGDASSSTRNVKAVVYPSREMAAWGIEWQAEDVGEEPDGPPCRAPARRCGSGRSRWHAAVGGAHG
jgi:hypothetical protein